MKDKKTMHVIIAILLDIAISLLVPASNGLTEVGVRTIGAAVATVYLWTFVATEMCIRDRICIISIYYCIHYLKLWLMLPQDVFLYKPGHAVLGIRTVSYTHLDVYKRQHLNQENCPPELYRSQ